VVWANDPLAPVIVRVELPVEAPLVVTVNVLDPLPLICSGLKLAVAFAGKPEIDKLMVPLNPPLGVT
jgi:hypothetical protein